jgi:hypothetical protein
VCCFHWCVAFTGVLLLLVCCFYWCVAFTGVSFCSKPTSLRANTCSTYIFVVATPQVTSLPTLELHNDLKLLCYSVKTFHTVSNIPGCVEINTHESSLSVIWTLCGYRVVWIIRYSGSPRGNYIGWLQKLSFAIKLKFYSEII